MTKTVRIVLLAGAVMYAASCAAESTDAEIREGIVLYHTPRCGGEPGSSRRPALIEVLDVDGNTNRLARILEELAQTNDNWNARMALHDLRIYGTPAQLPFLYSQATNAQYGAHAMEAIFAIEGVTSNSLSAARDYLFLTNKFSFAGIDERSDTCVKLLTRVNNDPVLAEFRLEILGLATNFLENVELMPNVLDGTLCGQYEGFRFSRGRLSMLRSARQRVTQELADITGNDPEASGKIHCYTFQTNYLSTSINELVAYPEADLPD